MSDKDQSDPREKIGDAARIDRVDASARVIRSYSDAEQGELAQWLTAYQRSRGLSTGKVVAILGFSWATIDRWRRGTYGDIGHAICAVVERLRNRTTEAKRPRPTAQCVATSIAEDIAGFWKHLEYLRDRGLIRIGLLYGPSGAGKSVVSRAICERRGGVYVQAHEHWKSPLAAFDTIAAALQLPPTRPTQALTAALVRRLSGERIIILVDDAHHLRKEALSGLAQTFIDAARVPLVLCGQPKLAQTVFAGKSDQGCGATLYSRIGPRLDIASAAEPRTIIGPGGKSVTVRERRYLVTMEDVKRFLASRELRLHPRAIDLAHRLANMTTAGMFRLVETVCETARYVNPAADALTYDMLSEALDLIASVDEAAAVARAEALADKRTAEVATA